MEFSGGLVVRTWHFDCRRHYLTPGQGTKISPAEWRRQNKKKGKDKINTLVFYLLLSHHGSPLIDRGCSILTCISIIKYLHILYIHTYIYIYIYTHIYIKRIKYLGINLTKGERFSHWQLQTWLKEIKDDTNKWSDNPCSRVQRLNVVNMFNTTQSEYVKAVYCHPAYLTYMQSTSWEMQGWKKHKLESRLPGEISITSDIQMTLTTLMAESEEELKSLLMKMKEESEKAGLSSTFRKLRSWHLVPSLHGK